MPTFGFTGELQQGSNVYLRTRWYNAARALLARDGVQTHTIVNGFYHYAWKAI